MTFFYIDITITEDLLNALSFAGCLLSRLSRSGLGNLQLTKRFVCHSDRTHTMFFQTQRSQPG